MDLGILTPYLIGRALHFEALQNILLEVQAGHGHCMLLMGGAGVGKSRLLRDFLKLVEESRWRTESIAYENDTGECVFAG